MLDHEGLKNALIERAGIIAFEINLYTFNTLL